ncbi:MAG: carbohydrate-binding domain-containing protein [Ruminococcus sp.]|nr:carbohydrate-binding domain-containing protein [Ruminococcus sp.]
MAKADIKKLIALSAAVMLVMCGGCSKNGSDGVNTETTAKSISADDVDKEISAEDLDVGYEETEAVNITFSESGADISGNGAVYDNETVTISVAGTYILSGSGSGRIVVNADKNAEIKLVLNGLDLTCSDNAPISVTEADKVYLILEDGSENVITDGESYNISDEDNTDGAIFAKSDLTINGGGSLTVNANYKHGIVSKDDLVITGGDIRITSASTSIEGKDSVKISGGTFDLSAGTNGIKATNTEETDKGFISIYGGTFTVNASGDAFDAESVLTVDGGEFNITTGGGSDNASMKSDGTPNDDWHNDMQGGMDRADRGDMGDMTPPDGFGGGDFQPTTAADNQLDIENASNTQSFEVIGTSADSETASAKALKSGGSILITGGTFDINSADDSIHSNGDVTISGGTIIAASGDDGVHADGNLLIEDGNITVTKSYEGLEGMTVTIAGGEISVTSSDDGINSAGGSDTGSTDRMGRDQFASQEGVFLNITGGNLYIDASGDGLDSNGDLYMSGGTVYVSGPENSGNGALDFNGEAIITGGTIVASGAIGMEECFGENSEQYVVLHDFSGTLSAGTEFTVTDSSGNQIISFTNEKTWQGVVFSSPELKEGETFTVSAGDESESITIESIVTSNSQGGMFGGGKGGHGGGRGF